MKGARTDSMRMPLSQRKGVIKGKKLDVAGKNVPSSSTDPTEEIMAYFNSSVRSDEERAVYRAMLNEISASTKMPKTRISSTAEIESNVEKTLSTIPLSSLKKPLGSKTFMDPSVNRLSMHLNRKLERGNVAKGCQLRSRSSLNSRGDFKDSTSFLSSMPSNEIFSLGLEPTSKEDMEVDYGSDFDIYPFGNQIRPKTRRFDAAKNLLLTDGKRVLKKTQRVASVIVNKPNNTPRTSKPHTPKTPKTNQIPLTSRKISISKMAVEIGRQINNNTKSENLIHVQPASLTKSNVIIPKKTPRNYNQNVTTIRSINIKAPFFNNPEKISPSLSSTSCSKTEDNTNKTQYESKGLSSILKDKKGPILKTTTATTTHNSGRKGTEKSLKSNPEILSKFKKEVPLQTLAKLLGNSDMVSLKSFSQMLSKKEDKDSPVSYSPVLSPKKTMIKKTLPIHHNTQESDSTDNGNSNFDHVKIPENKNEKHIQNNTQTNTNCQEEDNGSGRIPTVKKKVMTKRKSKSNIPIEINLKYCLARQEKLEHDVQEFIAKIEKDTASKSCSMETLQTLDSLVKTQKQIINMQIDLKKQHLSSINGT